MRDYWLVQYLLAAVGWSYIIVVLIATGLALKLSKSRQAKVLATAIVLGLSAILPLKGYQGYRKEQQEAQAYKARLEKAQALFAQRCKTAGEKIYRTVEGVEGVYLTKVRPDNINHADQYAMDDPYGKDLGGEAYAHTMLWGKADDGFTLNNRRERISYRYVYAEDPKDATLYRYELGPNNTRRGDPEIVRTPVKSALPHYGVTFDDISTREDRDNWIAGSSLRILDLRTNDAIAERVGYMFDAGLGNTHGGRQPWSFAAYNACPAFPKLHNAYPQQVGQTRLFVEKVLKPIQGK